MPFPVDDATLLAVEHALGGAYRVEEDGTHVLVGADYSLTDLLDFLANCQGRDPNEILIQAARDEDDLPEWERGLLNSTEIVDSEAARCLTFPASL